MTDEELKANRLKWIEALESGEWKQARSAWRGENMKHEMRHCCLDVANCLFTPEKAVNGLHQSEYKYIFNEGAAKELGIDVSGDNDIPGTAAWFMYMNDKLKYTFKGVATAARELWGLPR